MQALDIVVIVNLYAVYRLFIVALICMQYIVCLLLRCTNLSYSVFIGEMNNVMHIHIVFIIIISTYINLNR